MNESAAAWAYTALTRAVRESVLTVLAMAAAIACSQAVARGPASGVLGAVLALSLARSHLAAERRGWLEALVLLPVVSVASLGIAALLHHAPWLGAAAFIATATVPSWTRRLGAKTQHLGRLVALPLVTVLVVPRLPQQPAWALPPGLAVFAPAVVALLALACVLLAQGLGRVTGWLPPRASAAPSPAPAAAPGTLRPSAPVRLALQMVVTLAVAFAVGFLAFPAHWRWLVLSALLVNLGSIGRFDVLRRGVLRVLGAAGGTVLAMGVAGHAAGDVATVGALALACVFVGLVLRVFGYGWWVLCVTLALALLQTLEPAAEPLLLWRRLLEIAVGALIAVAASALVFPIPSTDILRRRIANALAAMSAALDPQATERPTQDIIGAINLVRQMTPVFRAHGLAHRLARRPDAAWPALWIDSLLACEAPVLVLVERGQTPGAVRQAIGAARRTMREPDEIGAALAALRAALEAAAKSSR